MGIRVRGVGLLVVGWFLQTRRRDGFLGGVSRGEVLGKREERVRGVVF